MQLSYPKIEKGWYKMNSLDELISFLEGNNELTNFINSTHCIFPARIEYDTVEYLVEIIAFFNSGKIILHSDKIPPDLHTEFNAKFQNMIYNRKNNSLEITGISQKMKKEYKVSIFGT
jgi:hypothetical protein